MIPFDRILTDGKARNGKNKGMRCGRKNLEPESTIESLIFLKLEDTFSNGSVDKIPANCKGRQAKTLPDLRSGSCC